MAFISTTKTAFHHCTFQFIAAQSVHHCTVFKTSPAVYVRVYLSIGLYISFIPVHLSYLSLQQFRTCPFICYYIIYVPIYLSLILSVYLYLYLFLYMSGYRISVVFL